MFGIVLSALNAILGFLFRGVAVKFLIFTALLFVVQGLVGPLVSLLPSGTNITELYGRLPDGVIYFLNLFMFTEGIKIILIANLTRFIIRRLPVIG